MSKQQKGCAELVELLPGVTMYEEVSPKPPPPPKEVLRLFHIFTIIFLRGKS